jgi:hypothetical protein
LQAATSEGFETFRRTAKQTVMYASAAAKRQAVAIVVRVMAHFIDFAALLSERLPFLGEAAVAG